jgi:hypothetical protein
MFQTCIRETAGSNLGGLMDILNEIIHSFPQALEANAEIVSSIRLGLSH